MDQSGHVVDYWLSKVDVFLYKSIEINNISSKFQYIPDFRGKKVRARLVLFTASALGVLGEHASILAAAVEMIHNASLFHDDVIDQAKMRRGNETLHELHGNRIAIMMGDLYFAKALEMISWLNSYKVYISVSKAVVNLAYGQLTEEFHKNEIDISLKEYFNTVDKKTGSIFSLCFELPGIIAGISDENLEKLRKAGILLGRIFQATDDMLDITSDINQTGKDAFRDISEGILTLPYILLLSQNGKDDERSLLQNFLGKKDICVNTILNMINKNGLKQKVNGYIEEWLSLLHSELSSLDTIKNTKELITYCEELAYRNR